MCRMSDHQVVFQWSGFCHMLYINTFYKKRNRITTWDLRLSSCFQEVEEVTHAHSLAPDLCEVSCVQSVKNVFHLREKNEKVRLEWVGLEETWELQRIWNSNYQVSVHSPIMFGGCQETLLVLLSVGVAVQQIPTPAPGEPLSQTLPSSNPMESQSTEGLSHI